MVLSDSAGRRMGLVTRGGRWGSCLPARHCSGVPWMLLLLMIQKWVILCTSGLAKAAKLSLAMWYHPDLPAWDAAARQG